MIEASDFDKEGRYEIINYLQSKNYKINIYNLKGALISSHNAKGLQTKINLSDLSSGSYIIELKDSNVKTAEFRKIFIKN